MNVVVLGWLPGSSFLGLSINSSPPMVIPVPMIIHRVIGSSKIQIPASEVSAICEALIKLARTIEICLSASVRAKNAIEVKPPATIEIQNSRRGPLQDPVATVASTHLPSRTTYT